MRNVKNTMIDKMLSVVAPHLCSGCGKTGTFLCDHCKYDIIKQPFLGCVLCERPISSGICKSHHVSYQQVWVVGDRKDTVQRLIDGFKFSNQKAAARSLAGLLQDRLPPLLPDTVLVPIPTAPAHIRERGYDHALLIAQYVGQLRGLPLDATVLVRRSMASQRTANRKGRIEQARTAFAAKGMVDSEKHYVLIDDVFTTGSTVQNAAQVLRDAGAQQVSVAIIARQPLD